MSARWSTVLLPIARATCSAAFRRPSLLCEFAGVGGDLGNAEVEDFAEVLSPSVTDQRDVLRFEITMNDLLGVRSRQAVAKLLDDVADERRLESSFFVEKMREGLPIQELHDEVRRAIVELAEVGDVDDGDYPPNWRLELLQKAPHGFLVLREFGMEDLDGEGLVDDLVVRQVNAPHSAFTQNGLEHVAVADDEPNP